MFRKLYKYIFWTGYVAVMITAFLPISFRVDTIKLWQDAFRIRTDHLLHFAVYFMICMYYLAGQKKNLLLFRRDSLKKFLLLLLLLAVLTELAQLWVPARSFNVFDMVSNVAGVLIGVWVIRTVRRYDGTTVERD